MRATTKGTTKENNWVICGIVVLLVLVVGMLVWMWCYGRPVVMCKPGDLTLSMGQQSGAAGTIYVDAIMKNHSNRSCWTAGYPTALLTDSSGVQVGSAAGSNTIYAPAQLTVKRNAEVHTLMAFPQHGNFDPGVCSGPSTNLKIYPPAGVDALTVPFVQYSCPGWRASVMQPGA